VYDTGYVNDESRTPVGISLNFIVVVAGHVTIFVVDEAVVQQRAPGSPTRYPWDTTIGSDARNAKNTKAKLVRII
jgi:hypothetical protein